MAASCAMPTPEGPGHPLYHLVRVFIYLYGCLSYLLSFHLPFL